MFKSKVTFTIGLTTKEGGKLAPTEVIRRFSEFFDLETFTVNKGIEYWKGVQEDNLAFTILSVVGLNTPYRALVKKNAKKLAALFSQECVLWEVQQIEGGLGYAF